MSKGAVLTSLAEERTLLANERTLLSYFRTSLAFLVLGAFLPKISISVYVPLISFVFFFFGACLLLLGWYRFVVIRARILHIAPWRKLPLLSAFRSFFMGLFLRKP